MKKNESTELELESKYYLLKYTKYKTPNDNNDSEMWRFFTYYLMHHNYLIPDQRVTRIGVNESAANCCNYATCCVTVISS